MSCRNLLIECLSFAIEVKKVTGRIGGKRDLGVFISVKRLKMEYEDKKYIVRKLMQDTLTEEERTALQASRQVTRKMEHQWDNAPDAVRSDRPDEPSIWQNICREVWSHGEGRKVAFYKIYSMVASILLVLGVAGTAYFALQGKANVPMYVVSSGIRNMESVSLPDGTKVQMGPGSRLTYPASFSGKTREITLDGQAFFDVAKNREKPFIVHTEDMSVEALGTAFELFSYDMENKIEAILLNGKIKVSVADKETNRLEEYLVSPDEKILVDRQTGKITKQIVDADKYTAWRKQKMLSFENEKLSMIIPRLEQWYGRKVMCQKDLANKYRFTFKVRDESLEKILMLIQLSSPLKYKEVEDGNYCLIR